tara:strand:- start:36 stop:485 length:450 start_codon:yes stop_codon:yes gene_type:complete
MQLIHADIKNIQSWKNVDFYRDSNFITITEVTATFQEKPQVMFNVLSCHSYDSTPSDIEKNILRGALETLDQESLNELVKFSSCNYWMDKYDPIRQQKIIDSNQFHVEKGKWYFQPDQRCEVVQSFIDENPEIAKDVLPHQEWVKSQRI